jgi:stress response protein YsnF
VHEEVEVKRVPVNRVVEQVPTVRRKGAVIIVPVVEEELVVTKRLVLKEEIHLIKRRTRDRFVKDVTLERERAEVQRLDAEGRIVDTRVPRAGRVSGRRGLLG